MSLLITGTVRISPDKVDAARAAMKEMILQSRAEDGCIQYSYSEDVLEAGLIHVTEEWRDHTALDLHFATGHLKRWRSSWQQLEISDRQLMIHEVSDTRPI